MYTPEPDSYWKDALKSCKYHIDQLKLGDMSRIHLSELARYLEVLEREIPERMRELEQEKEDYWEDCHVDCDEVDKLEREITLLQRKLREQEDWEKIEKERDELKQVIDALKTKEGYSLFLSSGGK